tara:strand:- start:42 stop:2228 length:2187 start_codon:yes stop_codon:yes gene_type:complete
MRVYIYEYSKCLRHGEKFAQTRNENAVADNDGINEFLSAADFWAWESDASHVLTSVSDQFTNLTSLEKTEFVNRSRFNIIDSSIDADYWAEHRKLLERRENFSHFRYPLRPKDGRIRWFEASGSPRFDAAGAFLGYRGVARDVTMEVAAKERLEVIDREARLQRTLLAQVERVAKIGAWRWSLADNLVEWTDEIYNICGIPIGTVLDFELASSVYKGEAMVKLTAAIDHTIETGKPFDIVIPMVTDAGISRWVRAIGEAEFVDNELSRLFGTYQDVTHEREQHLELERLALVDPLTGIANRSGFHKQFAKLLDQPVNSPNRVALCVVDLNNFKEINDQFGHDLGDTVLVRFTEWFSKRMGDRCHFSRLGGDEFAVLIEHSDEPKSLEKELTRLFSNFKFDVVVENFIFNISACAGYAVFPTDSTESAELMRYADLALYAAKRDDSAILQNYNPAMMENFRRRVVVTQEFRRALSHNQVVPFYQPIVDLQTGEVSGVEALARWVHPQQGILSPEAFMEIFDDPKTCVELCKNMLEQICSDMIKWDKAGFEVGRIGCNVTAADLRQPGFSLEIINMLSRYGLHPNRLVLEVTETTVFGTSVRVITDQLKHLLDAGVRVALDDFGIGYSSLTHLKSLPFSILKIDKSFVKDMMKSRSDRAIVQSLVQLGREIGYSTVAEGIESKTEADHLRTLGCERGQGYFFYRPMPSEEVLKQFSGKTITQHPKLSNGY